MVESRVGAEGLTEFLRGWFSRHAEEAVTTSDLARELAARFPEADLPRFFEEWVFGEGFPVLAVTVAKNALSVAQVQTRGPDGGFHATIEIALSDGARTERVRVSLEGPMSTHPLPEGFQPSRIEVDPDGWLYALPRCDTRGAACRAGTRCVRSTAGMVCAP
jgi:aminopeptidase N